jgi:hypothetical protein
VKALAAEAAKDLAVHEKEAVGLEERRKHANGKAKKLKKSLNDVRIFLSQYLQFLVSDHVALFRTSTPKQKPLGPSMKIRIRWRGRREKWRSTKRAWMQKRRYSRGFVTA